MRLTRAIDATEYQAPHAPRRFAAGAFVRLISATAPWSGDTVCITVKNNPYLVSFHQLRRAVDLSQVSKADYCVLTTGEPYRGEKA